MHFNEIVHFNQLETPCIICITLLPEGLFHAGSQQLHSLLRFFSFTEACKSDFLSRLLSFFADAFL